MEIQLLDQPLRFRLRGLSAPVGNQSYGEVGCRLMEAMWKLVRQAKLKTTGHTHWVYFADDRMFVGVEIPEDERAAIPAELERCEFELPRCSKHVHLGPYHELPQKWWSLRAELSARGETVTMPSLEIYGHVCEDDESTAETTILLGLHPEATKVPSCEVRRTNPGPPPQ